MPLTGPLYINSIHIACYIFNNFLKTPFSSTIHTRLHLVCKELRRRFRKMNVTSGLAHLARFISGRLVVYTKCQQGAFDDVMMFATKMVKQ